ncbi:putative cupin superfamily protein [Povalibacter uvarum]|uniref:Putative cupin superfamily protein n=1 Tax=Povalibacter uvarum TaxID=732238 RepID=A0A841HNX9_9GAMM|nr:cupin domain-containing protein [Povalibacter uvarum]MBB6093970.1 putative cupin superfamily protein [Povalibacter uvarum]
MKHKIDMNQVSRAQGSGYPAPFDEPCRERLRRRLGDAAGLTQFGVNLLTLPPGAWSSQRHWHTIEDEFVFVLDGEVVLVTDAGEDLLSAGDCAGFPAGAPDGHHLQNRSARSATVLEVGTRRPADDEVFYSDIDMHAPKGDVGYAHRDGRPYPRK